MLLFMEETSFVRERGCYAVMLLFLFAGSII